jgi:hypothetical protein
MNLAIRALFSAGMVGLGRYSLALLSPVRTGPLSAVEPSLSLHLKDEWLMATNGCVVVVMCACGRGQVALKVSHLELDPEAAAKSGLGSFFSSGSRQARKNERVHVKLSESK